VLDTSSHSERDNPRGKDLPVASDDAGSPITVRKILKVLPRLAAALVNAQLRIRGKARVPLLGPPTETALLQALEFEREPSTQHRPVGVANLDR